MSDLRHDERLVDTATLTERLRAEARELHHDGEGTFYVSRETLHRRADAYTEAAAALSALDERLGETRQVHREEQGRSADRLRDAVARAVDAEAREKAQRQTAEHNWQERVAAEAREKALIEGLERLMRDVSAELTKSSHPSRQRLRHAVTEADRCLASTTSASGALQDPNPSLAGVRGQQEEREERA